MRRLRHIGDRGSGSGHYLYKGRKVVPKDPLQHPLGRPRAMSRHAPYSTSHTITLTGIAVHSVRQQGVQTAYAWARAFKSTICWRETAVRLIRLHVLA